MRRKLALPPVSATVPEGMPLAGSVLIRSEAAMVRLLALRMATVLAFASIPRSAVAADAIAAVVVADDGGLDVPAVHAIRSVTASELRKRGFAVADDGSQDRAQPVNAELARTLQQIGVTRVFVLRIRGRLGEKVPLSLEEVSPQRLTPVAEASLTVTSLDEADIVATRLVSAVLDRRSADDTAGMRTVTVQEARPFLKKPGDRFWVMGLPLVLTHGSGDRSTPLGVSVSYFYEAEFFRLGASAIAATRDNSALGWFGIDAAWIPLDGEVSPYFGAGLGYMGAADTGGLGGRFSIGAELFRLHRVRLLLGVDAVIPLFTTASTATNQIRAAYPMFHLQLGL
jgi:hypothetical protein